MTAPPLLAHRREGEGPDLLLLNGGLMSLAAWEPWARALRRQFRVLRCDLRGQLLSPGTPPAEMSGHAAEVARLLDHLGIARTHVVGVSFGAFVAMLLAAAHARRVASLVLITASDRFTPEMHAGFAEGRALCREAQAGGDGGRVYDAVVPTTFSAAWRQQNAGALAQRRAQFAALPAAHFAGLEGLLAALARLDLAPVLPRIACPTLVVGAECDATFPVAHSRALAAAIPGAGLAVLAGAPHGAILEHADEALALVDAHLRACPAPPASDPAG